MIQIFTDQNFEKEVLNSTETVLVDFWAPWCGPCRIQSPIVEELAKEMEGKKVKMGKLNVDENQDTAQKFTIMSIPTLIIFKNGSPAEQMIGIHQKSQLKAKIEKYLSP